ncbi:MAG: RNA 3'-terminal phosphate cyclase, partial [Caldimicrobium sp.]
EGGGQVLRTALSLSAIFLKPIKLFNIRAKRPKPGLQPQHLACLKACRELTSAITKGEELHSQEIIFSPQRRPKSGTYFFNIGTAGSTSLLFQTLLYPLAFSEGGTLILQGGTHVPYSPTFHYLERIFQPVLTAFGFKFNLYLEKAGFYPKGDGIIRAHIEKISLFPLQKFSPGFQVEKVGVLSLSSNDLPTHIIERQAQAAYELLSNANFPVEISKIKLPSASPGTMLFVYGKDGKKRAGFTALGKKGIPAEKVGKEAASAFLNFLESNAQVDPYLGDQLLLPITLVLLQNNEKFFTYTVSKITNHLLTQAWLIPQFLDKIKIKIFGKIHEKGEVVIERA